MCERTFAFSCSGHFSVSVHWNTAVVAEIAIQHVGQRRIQHTMIEVVQGTENDLKLQTECMAREKEKSSCKFYASIVSSRAQSTFFSVVIKLFELIITKLIQKIEVANATSTEHSCVCVCYIRDVFCELTQDKVRRRNEHDQSLIHWKYQPWIRCERNYVCSLNVAKKVRK